MRRISVIMVAATVVLLGFAPAPAYAERLITASIAGSATCSSGQIMTGGKFTLTRVSAGQKIDVHTELSVLTRDHNSFASGTAFYDVAFDARLNTDSPATASVPDNWNGTFQMTAASCSTAIAPRVSAQGNTCGLVPEVAVRVTNSNAIMVRYRISGNSMGTQYLAVAGRRTEGVQFTTVMRGQTYQVTAEGDDDTTGSASVTVPACEGIPDPLPTRPLPSFAQTPASPGASLSPTPTSTSTATPTPTPSVTGGAFVQPSTETQEGVVFDPLQAEPKAASDKHLLSYPSLWVGALVFILGFAGVAWLWVRRRST